MVPPELLEEVFELNMQLQELKMGERDPETVKGLQASRDAFAGKLRALDEELKAEWAEWDRADAERRLGVRDRMVGLLNRRNYLRNLVRDVNQALEA